MSAIGQIASRIKTYVHEHRELPPALDALRANDESINEVTELGSGHWIIRLWDPTHLY